MSAPTESAPTSAQGEQATRQKKRRSMLANGPQCDIPVVPEHCRIGSVNLQLKGIWVVRRRLLVFAWWPPEHDIRMTTGREQGARRGLVEPETAVIRDCFAVFFCGRPRMLPRSQHTKVPTSRLALATEA